MRCDLVFVDELLNNCAGDCDGEIHDFAPAGCVLRGYERGFIIKNISLCILRSIKENEYAFELSSPAVFSRGRH